VRVGVFTDGLGHLPLPAALAWLSKELPDVRELEIGTGGYSPAQHCAVDALASDAGAARSWLDEIEASGFRLAALNVNGNPLEEPSHDRALRSTIRLAAMLEIDVVACMSGGRAELSGGAWFPGVEKAVDSYWRERVLPYWGEIAELAATSRPSLRLCLELEPGSAAFNVSTVEKLLAIAPNLAVNLDPSHFFWQKIDPLAATRRLGRRIGFAHGKDTVLDAEKVAIDGVLDRTTWRYASVGRGRPTDWWTTFLETMRTSGYDGVVSVEHEDESVTPEAGIAESAQVLAEALEAARIREVRA
jgi:sugar phosphate isomerase/epimerase